MKKQQLYLTILALIFAGFGGWYIGIQKEPEVRIIEKKIEIERREYCPGITACAPCIEGPQWEQCEFKSFAYEAIRDEKDLYGNYELKKGDIYYYRIRNFEYFWDYFCTENGSNCFDHKMILRKDLFKPIN